MTRPRIWARLSVAAALMAVVAGSAACTKTAGGEPSQGVELPPPSPTSGTARTTVSAAQEPAAGTWWSGASSPSVTTGAFGRWRRATVTVGGTWDNGNYEQVKLRSICPGGEWARWNKPLDEAIGAIDKGMGESWAKAAKGAYDARWRKSLLQMKKCWGKRNPANLYIRFAHEFNLGSMPWSVKGTEVKDFKKALTRYSNLRYLILPKANIVLCPTDGTDQKLGLDVRAAWPGKDAKGRWIANVYGIDTYNGYIVVHTPREFSDKLQRYQHGWLFGMETHRAFAESLGVPFAVCEWGNNGDPNDPGHGSEAPDYMRMMNEYFREHAGDPKNPQPGKLLYEVQFNLQKQFQIWPTKLQPQTAAAYRSLVWGH